MGEIRLTTTGTQSPVVIDDLGARSFTHPVTNFDLLAEFTEDEVQYSADLQALLTAAHITLTDENAVAITTVQDASPHTHLAENLIDPLTLQETLFLKARNETGLPIAKGKLVAATGFSVPEGRILVSLADKDDSAKRPAVGVATEAIANNSNTDVLLSVGTLSGINTSSFAINDQLVLGDDGDFSRPPPEVDPFTGEIQLTGSVTRVDASLGEIFVTLASGLLPMTAAEFFAVRETSPTGGVSGGEVTRATGLNVDVAAGSGFVNDNIDVFRVTWSAVANLTLVASNTNFIFVDKNNLVQTSISPPDIENNIVLADAITDGTTVVLLANHQVLLQELPAGLDDYAREVVGNVVVSGLTTTQAVAIFRVKVDLGTFYTRSFKVTVPATDPITFTYWFRDGSGGFTRVAGSTLIDKDNRDDGTGVLNSLLAGEFKKDLLFVVFTATGLVEYHVFYGQEVFTSQSEAEAGNLPSADGDVIANGVRSPRIVIEGAAAAIASFVDVRPFLGQLAPGTTAVTDHGLLSGLADDDHTQYIPTDGSRPVTNAILADMATQTFKGRDTAGTGDPEDLSAATVRTILNVADGANNYVHPNHTGDVTSVADGAQTIAGNAVTNAKLADVATQTLKGRTTAATGDPEDLTAAQARTLLNVADGAEANTASNVGTGGVGVFKQKTVANLEFKNINASEGVAVSNDVANNEVDLELDINGLTTDSNPSAANDFLVFYDTSEGVHNKADIADILDAEWKHQTIDKDLTAPPGSPADEDQYIVATGGTGAWVGQDGNFAIWNAETSLWVFKIPEEGWFTWVLDEDKLYRYLTSWGEYTNYTHPNHTGDVTSVADGAQTIAADAVTNAKLADVATQTLKGRTTAATGDPEDLTAAQARTLLNVADGANNYVHPNHTGDVTSVADGAQTIAADAVTYAKMQNVVSDQRLLGNIAGAGGIVTELTSTQVLALLGVEALADVTDSTNVDAAGATMNTDSDVSGNTYVLDEDNMVSDSNTKLATQQSIKKYVDDNAGGDTLPVADTTGIAKGSADATKIVRFEVDGLTTGTTRVITPPDKNITLDDVGDHRPPHGDSYICLQDQKAQNTAGGTFTSGAWRTRVLNTEQADSGNHVTLSANQFTLDAGDYVILAFAPCHKVAANQARLQNITDGTTIITGMSVSAPASGENHIISTVMGKFTIAASKALELQHRCTSTLATNGFGIKSNFTTEVYSTVQLWKVG